MLNYPPDPIQMTVSSAGLGEHTVRIEYKTNPLECEGMIMLGMAEDVSHADAVAAILEQAELKNEEPMYVFPDGVPFIYPARAVAGAMGQDAMNILVMPTRKKKEERDTERLQALDEMASEAQEIGLYDEKPSLGEE